MYFHYQNLKREDNEKDRVAHGRFWLGTKPQLHCEYVVPGNNPSLALTLGGEDRGIDLHIGLVLFDLFVGIGTWKFGSWMRKFVGRKDQKYGNEREVGMKYFGGTLWLMLWHDPMESRSVDPKWWMITLNFKRMITGRHKYTVDLLTSGPCEVILPENRYQATFKVERQTWLYPRWMIAKQRDLITVDIEGKGIPIPGKGENSWDCGDDAIRSVSSSTDYDNPSFTIQHALKDLAIDVLKRRQRYASLDWLPRDEADEIIEENIKAHARGENPVAGVTDQMIGKE